MAVDTSTLKKNVDLMSLKSDVDESYIDKLKRCYYWFKQLKIFSRKINVNKLKTVPSGCLSLKL